LVPFIVTSESSFSGGEWRLLEPPVDFKVKVIKGRFESRAGGSSWGGLGEAVSEDTGVDSGEEEGDAEALVRDGVAVGLRDSGDEAVEAKAP